MARKLPTTSCRRSHERRGLKLPSDAKSVWMFGRRSHERRGLKRFQHNFINATRQSPLTRAAWIETEVDMGKKQIIIVAAHTSGVD